MHMTENGELDWCFQLAVTYNPNSETRRPYHMLLTLLMVNWCMKNAAVLTSATRQGLDVLGENKPEPTSDTGKRTGLNSNRRMRGRKPM